MPYFLTDQYKAVLEASQVHTRAAAIREENALNPKKPGQAAVVSKSDQGPVGIYKSEFLRTKVEQQNDKRKKDRRAAPRGQ